MSSIEEKNMFRTNGTHKKKPCNLQNHQFQVLLREAAKKDFLLMAGHLEGGGGKGPGH